MRKVFINIDSIIPICPIIKSTTLREGLLFMAAMEYLDFEIEIGPGVGRDYPLAVVRSPGGEARGSLRFPFDELALESRLKDLQIALLRSGGGRRVVPTREEQNVQEFGQALFDALMTGEIRSRYDVSQREASRQGKGLRLKLRIQPPGLASLPWEFMYDARAAEYVCLSTQTPLVRYIELPQVIQPLTVTPPLRILGLTASPRGLAGLDIDNEKRRVETALENLTKVGQVHITWLEHATWRNLQRAMRTGTWNILHFIGHGAFDRAGDEGFIALEDENGELSRLPATQLGRLLADHATLRLAILNSCEGAQGGLTDIFSSTASILVRRGLPAVLAMQYEITDRAAIEFARGFYEALSDGLPVDAATTEARKSVSLGLSNTIEWGTPVLFMRAPDGVLFRAETPAEKRYRLQIERQKREQTRRERENFQAQLAAEQAERETQRLAAERLAKEAAEQEAREKAAREQVERESQRLAAEKAAREKTEREAARKAALEQAEREAQRLAAEKIAKEKAEQEARAQAAREQERRAAAQKATHEQAGPDAAQRPVLESPVAARRQAGTFARGALFILFGLCVGAAAIWGISSLASPVLETKTFTPTLASTASMTPTVTSTLTIETTPIAESTPTTESIPTAESTPASLPSPPEITEKGATMVLIPAGPFSMGSDNGDSDEKPAHIVDLPAFYIDKYEVTNAHYKACVEAGGCSKPGDTARYNDSQYANHPVVTVDWNQARVYCEWRGKETDGKTRLPSEAEWEKAAGWDEKNQTKYIYPWGNDFKGSAANFCDKNCAFDWSNKDYDDGYAETAPVGSYEFGKSPYGVYDMAGNVWEWVADWYDVYPGGDPGVSSAFGQTYRVLRGGSWNNSPYYLRVSDRYRVIPSLRYYDLGFRCSR